MTIYDWAKKECEIACNVDNLDINDETFDYSISCYKSALKALKSLEKDEHSGTSIKFTISILERLANLMPLTPIEEKDFMDKDGNLIEDFTCFKDSSKSRVQCPRMSSLFRNEDNNGKITYTDIDRSYCINVEFPSETYCAYDCIDEMFPIILPYYPSKEKYKVYCQTFLTDPSNGDFDTRGILYCITPEGKRVDINRFFAEKDRKFVEITKEEYDERLKHRIDKINISVAQHLIWTLVNNTGSDDDISTKSEKWSKVNDSTKNRILHKLDELCEFFEDENHWKYHTFDICHKLCSYDLDNLPKLVGLHDIAEFLKSVQEKYLC